MKTSMFDFKNEAAWKAYKKRNNKSDFDNEWMIAHTLPHPENAVKVPYNILPNVTRCVVEYMPTIMKHDTDWTITKDGELTAGMHIDKQAVKVWRNFNAKHNWFMNKTLTFVSWHKNSQDENGYVDFDRDTLNDICAWVEDYQIYDKLGNFGDFYYKFKNILRNGKI